MVVAIAAPSTPNGAIGPKPKTQYRVKYYVDAIGKPQRPHGQRGIAGTSKDSIDEK